MPEEAREHPSVCSIQAPGEGRRLVHIILEEDIFTRAVALLAKHPDGDLARLVNVGTSDQIRSMEIDDAHPLPEPKPEVRENIERASVEEHAEISHRFLRLAQSELNRRRRSQASKAVWRGVAHALSAIAVKRGWDHLSSEDIASQLGKEFNRPDFWLWVGSAISLYDHEDFWGRVKEGDVIQDHIDQANAFVEELDELRERQPGPFTIKEEADQRRLARLLGIPRDQREQELPIGTVDPNGFSSKP